MKELQELENAQWFLDQAYTKFKTMTIASLEEHILDALFLVNYVIFHNKEENNDK